MEANDLKEIQTVLGQCVVEFEEKLQTEDLPPDLRKQTQDIKKLAETILAMSNRIHTASAQQSFRGYVDMTEWTTVLSNLQAALVAFPTMIMQNFQFQELMKLQKDTLSEVRARDQRIQEMLQATQTLVKEHATLQEEHADLLDDLATHRAWNMIYEIVQLAESSVWWKHSSGQKKSLHQAIETGVIAADEVAKDLGIETDRVSFYVSEIKKIKEKREPYGHLAPSMKMYTKAAVLEKIRRFGGDHKNVAEHLYLQLHASVKGNATLKELQDYVEVTRKKKVCEEK